MKSFSGKFMSPGFGSSLLKWGLCFSLLTGSAGMAFAEKQTKTGEVVVTATRTEKDLMLAPASVSIVTEQEIERKGYTSIADILQDVPGVEVFDQSLAGAKRINIRGESGARVLIMVDGQKITEQKSMDGAPLLVDPAIIERVEVIKGPASVLYGSEAIGGAVNIITKKGGETPLQGSGTITYDTSTDGFTESLSLFGAKNGFNYRVTGSHSDQGDRETPHDTLEESDSERTSMSGFLGYSKDKFSVGLGLDKFDSEVDSPPTNVGGSDFNLNLPEWDRQKASLFLDFKDLSSKVKKVHFDLYAQETEKDFHQQMKIPMGPMMKVIYDLNTFNEQKSYGGTAQVDVSPTDNHYMIAGYTYTRDTLDADSKSSSKPSMAFLTSSKFHEASIDTHAVFLQDEWMLGEDFILTLGGRQTWVSSELESTNDKNSNEGDVSDSQPVFSAGVTWSGIKNLTLRANASQGYRFPDLNKLFTGTSHGGSITLPNEDLDPESSDNFEIGARFNNGSWDLDLTAFMSNAEDYITTSKVGERTYKFDNVDEAKTHGVEASIKYRFKSTNITPYLNGTWMRRKFEKKGFSTWDTNTPSFLGRLGVKWEDEILDGKALLWTDAWMRAATDADDASSDGTKETTDGWQTANLSLGSEFGKNRAYKVSLNLNNIFNQSYTRAKNVLEEAGFHGVLSIGMKF